MTNTIIKKGATITAEDFPKVTEIYTKTLKRETLNKPFKWIISRNSEGTSTYITVKRIDENLFEVLEGRKTADI